MIIFGLDNILADCEHRRHFIDASKRDDCYYNFPATLTQSEGWYYKYEYLMCEPPKPKKFIADYESYWQACGDDKCIFSVADTLLRNMDCDGDVAIWSIRCESMRKQTEEWIINRLGKLSLEPELLKSIPLKMRPIGNREPEEVLKERWLEETYEDTKWGARTPIQLVFENHKPSIEMYRRRGIFVFDCNQG